MRAEWFGDKRDLVKWGVLLEIARRYNSQHILQVLYHRATKWGRFEIDGDEIDIDSAVLKHFRDLLSVSRIECGSVIEVMFDDFGNRAEYLSKLLERVRGRTRLPGIVFLDPDTGIEPERKPTLKHVLLSEIGEIWRALSRSDVLLIYQHKTNRSGAEWVQSKRRQFEEALGVPGGNSKIGRADGIASDVVFLFAEKGA